MQMEEILCDGAVISLVQQSVVSKLLEHHTPAVTEPPITSDRPLPRSIAHTRDSDLNSEDVVFVPAIASKPGRKSSPLYSRDVTRSWSKSAAQTRQGKRPHIAFTAPTVHSFVSLCRCSVCVITRTTAHCTHARYSSHAVFVMFFRKTHRSSLVYRWTLVL